MAHITDMVWMKLAINTPCLRLSQFDLDQPGMEHLIFLRQLFAPNFHSGIPAMQVGRIDTRVR